MMGIGFKTLNDLKKDFNFGLLAAVDHDWGIAKKGENGLKIPWIGNLHINDTKKFYEKITNSIIIIGRKTYQDMLKLVLSDRNVTSIVLSKNKTKNELSTYVYDDFMVCNNFFEMQLLLHNKKFDKENIWFSGGRRIYEYALDLANFFNLRAEISFIRDSYDCDRFFPKKKFYNTPKEYLNKEIEGFPKFSIKKYEF